MDYGGLCAEKTVRRPSVLPLCGIVARVFEPVRLVVGRRHGQTVAAVVLDCFGVALDPDETDVVAVVHAQETHPEIGVFLARESLADPAEDPAFRDSVDDVFRIGVDDHVRTLELERFERHAHGHQLHAVVGREAESLRQLLAVVSREKHCAVAARPGVSEGRAVGVDGDRRQNIRRLEIKHRVYDGMFRSGFPGLAPAVPPPAVSRFIRRLFRPVPCPESFSPGKRHSCNCVPVWCRPDRSERRTAGLRWHTFP